MFKQIWITYVPSLSSKFFFNFQITGLKKHENSRGARSAHVRAKIYQATVDGESGWWCFGFLCSYLRFWKKLHALSDMFTACQLYLAIWHLQGV